MSETDVHWGGEHCRPTSLHGNGAASFDRTSMVWADVTCRLCQSLRESESFECPDKSCRATATEGCRYPLWRLCGHPVERPTRSATSSEVSS